MIGQYKKTQNLGTETEDAIQIRLSNARKELTYKEKQEYIPSPPIFDWIFPKFRIKLTLPTTFFRKKLGIDFYVDGFLVLYIVYG